MSKLFEKVDDVFNSALTANESFVQCSRCGEYNYLTEGETICSTCKLDEESIDVNEADISIDSSLEPADTVSRTKELFEGFVHDLFAEKKNETEAVDAVDITYNETGATVTIFFNEEYVTTQFENPSWDEGVHDTYLDYFIDRFNQAGSIQNKLWIAELRMAGDFYEDIEITWIDETTDTTEVVEESGTALSAAENKLNDAIKTSNNQHELNNIQLFTTPEGNINVRTSDDKDIVTLNSEEFNDTEIEELRDKGYFNKHDETNLNEETSTSLLDEYGLNKDDSFRYMMLSRMQSDCKYYLGHGNRNEKDLWAKDPATHIAIMKELYDSLPEEPQWLTREELAGYEEEMVTSSVNESVELNEGFFNLYKSFNELYNISKYSPEELRTFLSELKTAGKISEKDYEILYDYADKYEDLINSTGYESTVESDSLEEAEVPASQLDFKHQQLAKIQSDIESIAELKAEDTSNELYTSLLDCYDDMVEILTKAIAEDPIGTVVGSDDEIGLTITDEEPTEEAPMEEPLDIEPAEEEPEVL